MLAKTIKKRLEENKLTATWLVSILADRGYPISVEAFRMLFQERSANNRSVTTAILHEANHILNQYENLFGRKNFKIGDMVEGESKYGEYLSGKVVQLKPEFIVETAKGFREPCYRAKAYTPTAR